MTIMEAVVTLVVALMGLLGAVVSRALIPYLRTQVSDAQLTKARQIAEFAVQAVEQLAPGTGAQARQKFNDAMSRAYDLAEAHGINLTEEQWRTLIEKAVYEIQQVEFVVDDVTDDSPVGVGKVVRGD